MYQQKLTYSQKEEIDMSAKNMQKCVFFHARIVHHAPNQFTPNFTCWLSSQL